MEGFKPQFLLGLLCVFVLSSCFGCTHKQSIDTAASETEVWELQLTGQTEGTLKMTLGRAETASGIFHITGKISGDIEDQKAGTGNADYKVDGKIEKGIFLARFNGYSYMAEGPSNVTGRMSGKFSSSEGSGSWTANHSRGNSRGQYTMRKLD